MLKLKLRVVWVAVVVALFGMTQPFTAVQVFAKSQAMELSPEQLQSIDKINAFFNSFQTLRGEFVQTSPRGRATRGVMHLAKPGKLRFEYEPPNPLLIASDGKWLTIKNKAKEKGDQVPLSSTPLRLIVASKLNLTAEANVIGFEQNANMTTVVLADKKGSLAGQIILVFDETANTLQQWIIVDGKGQRTTVELTNLEKDVKLNPKLFNVTINREKKN
jgi:outer membrane lipoprotein-sorting protein